LARAICYQQLAGRAAATIHGRFVTAVGGEVTPAHVLAAPPDALRGAGLSAAKAAAIKDLAEKVAGGEVALDRIGRLSDEDVIAHLIQVRGIGRWTAEMFLLGTLGRLDVWPVGDYGVRAGFAAAWGLAEIPSPDALTGHGEPFRPYRSIVAWYCWRVADNPTTVPT
jgi:3-methyladenine DNA glycosylase/8-oxoguanine DNA glycosylase